MTPLPVENAEVLLAAIACSSWWLSAADDDNELVMEIVIGMVDQQASMFEEN